MPDFIQQFADRVKALGTDWAKYSVVGSFALYVTGYLSLRFHLTVFGVSTDLAVVDERYLFSGARFLVYCVSTLPSIVLLVMPVAVIIWLIHRAMPLPQRAKLRSAIGTPIALTSFGILFSVCIIQFVMRQCFNFSDLLLAPALPAQPVWLARLLLNDEVMPVYFTALVTSTMISFSLLWFGRTATTSPALRAGRGLLWFLALVQMLMLPINYGILVQDQSLPRVTAIGEKPLKAGDEAWLVWEGKDDVTFLIRSIEPARRSLLAVPRADIKQIEVIGVDQILVTLFGT
jgi:hypothetical protein